MGAHQIKSTRGPLFSILGYANSTVNPFKPGGDILLRKLSSNTMKLLVFSYFIKPEPLVPFLVIFWGLGAWHGGVVGRNSGMMMEDAYLWTGHVMGNH